MEKVKLLFFNAPEKLPLIVELYNYYQRKNDYQTSVIQGSAEAIAEIASAKNGIVIFKVENKADLQEAVSFLKPMRKLIKRGLVRPTCLAYFKNKKVEGILRKYGCVDILDPGGLKAKTFSFKIDFWSKKIRVELGKVEKEAEREQREESKNEVKAPEKKSEFVEDQALECQSDIWIIRHRNDLKKVLRRYLCRLAGPSSHLGHWVELEAKPEDRQATWKFVINDSEGQFILEDGAWFFTGSKPEFDWRTKVWSFSADRPHLYFYTREGVVHSKIKFQGGQVHFAQNSTYAMTKEEAIEESCQSKFAFEADRNRDQDSETAQGGQEFASLDYLDGKGSIDSVEKNWEGESSIDDLGEDKLRGSLSHEAESTKKERKRSSFNESYSGNYGGKSKTDRLDHDSLCGDLDSQLKGDENDHHSLDASLKPGGNDSKSKKSIFKEGDLGGHYGGEAKTDGLGRDPLSGQLRPSNEDKQNKESEGFAEDDLGGHYGGEAKTDEINRDPLSGQLRPSNEDKQNKESEGFAEDDLGGHYGGEAKTDEINRDPLSSQLRPSKKDKQNKEREGFTEDDLGGHYGGEAKTDEFGRDPLSGQLRPSKKDKQNKESEGFTEDDLGGHYGAKSKANSEGKKRRASKEKSEEAKELNCPLEDEPLSSQLRPKLKKKQQTAKTGELLESETQQDPLFEDEIAREMNNLLSASGKINEAGSKREAEILDALDDSLTKGVQKSLSDAQLAGKVIPATNDKSVLGDQEWVSELSYESGEVSVVLRFVGENGENLDLHCDLEDFFLDELIIKADKKDFPPGTEVSATVWLQYGGREYQVKTEGKVLEVDDYEPEAASITLALEGVDEKDYDKFMGLYMERQENIQEFMRLAKGIE